MLLLLQEAACACVHACMYACVCVCVCVCRILSGSVDGTEREREREKKEESAAQERLLCKDAAEIIFRLQGGESSSWGKKSNN